jgi:CubicO group peptidase (beta-lactamase class C family)
MNNFLLLIPLAASFLPSISGGDRFDEIPRSVQAFVESHEISGAVMLLAENEKLLHLSAVGVSDIASGRTMQPDDLFWIASMTKPITAVAIAILADEGKLGFDDPMEKFLPEFADQWFMEETTGDYRKLIKSPRPITIRDALTHTSGLGEYPVRGKHWSLEEFSKSIAHEPLRFSPGSRWRYSTAGIDALGRVVEVVSGESFVQFLQKRLFDPLDMNDTTFWLNAGDEVRFARNYEFDEKTKRLKEIEIYYMNGGAVTDRERAPSGGAGLFSTAEDLANFYRMMLNKGAWNGRRILKSSTVAEMTRIQTGDLQARPGMPWGLGFCVIEDPSQMEANRHYTPVTFGHGGAHGTSSWVDPSTGIIYVFMIQRGRLRPNPDNSSMLIAFQNAAAKALGR